MEENYFQEMEFYQWIRIYTVGEIYRVYESSTAKLQEWIP
jgi:hypothetical protein